MQYTKALARFVAGTTYDELPRKVVIRAKECLLDALGVMSAGASTLEGKRIMEFATNLGCRKESTVIGGKLTSSLNAAFANGTLGEIVELNDGARIMAGHPSSVVTPATLAVGEKSGASGEDVITAIIVGYDVAIRIGAAMFPHHRIRGFINTGTSGTFGATAAAGKILGLDEKSMADAFGIAGFFAPASLYESFMGTTIKPAHGGQAAEVGVKSALLAEGGLGGAHTILEGPAGFIQATAAKFNLDNLTEKLGEEYKIMDVYFKPYACCRHTHGAVDAVLELIAKYNVNPDDVESILVKTNSGAFRTVCRYAKELDPYTSFQFSLPYIVAITLMDRKVGPSQFDEERIRNPKVYELMRKVKCNLDPELDRLYPKRRPTAVEIVTKSGETLNARTDFPKGTAENPMTTQQLRTKFKDLTSKVLGEEVEKVMNIVDKMENLGSINELMLLFRPIN
ncbi:MAG: MmgE/PrpD family protein [Candidatus Bathyarchaeota archaeon]|nr:MAG: MmgE/PrpD family protein [Candidatus Bathyarchaeota archaeon]